MSPGANMASNSKILIADDNQQNCELLEVYLADLDCEIKFAVDGKDTLEKVAAFQPDLILLDVMMPKLSGFEVCKQLKGNPTTSRIMILMVTALNELGDIERAVQGRIAEACGKHAEAERHSRRKRAFAAIHRADGRTIARVIRCIISGCDVPP
jgi:CheY-like chemotaxis protein